MRTRFHGENRRTWRKSSRIKDENQQQTKPTYDAKSVNRARITLVHGRRVLSPLRHPCSPYVGRITRFHSSPETGSCPKCESSSWFSRFPLNGGNLLLGNILHCKPLDDRPLTAALMYSSFLTVLRSVLLKKKTTDLPSNVLVRSSGDDLTNMRGTFFSTLVFMST